MQKASRVRSISLVGELPLPMILASIIKSLLVSSLGPKARRGDVRRSLTDIKKVQRLLGYEPGADLYHL